MKVLNKILLAVGALVAFQPASADFGAVGYGLADLVGRGIALESKWGLPLLIKEKSDPLKNKANGDLREAIAGVGLNTLFLTKKLEKQDPHAAFWATNTYSMYRSLYTIFPFLKAQNIAAKIATLFEKKKKKNAEEKEKIEEENEAEKTSVLVTKALLKYGLYAAYATAGAFEGTALSFKNARAEYAANEFCKRSVRNGFMRWMVSDVFGIKDKSEFYNKKTCEAFGDLGRQAAYYYKQFVRKK